MLNIELSDEVKQDLQKFATDFIVRTKKQANEQCCAVYTCVFDPIDYVDVGKRTYINRKSYPRYVFTEAEKQIKQDQRLQNAVDTLSVLYGSVSNYIADLKIRICDKIMKAIQHLTDAKISKMCNAVILSVRIAPDLNSDKLLNKVAEVLLSAGFNVRISVVDDVIMLVVDLHDEMNFNDSNCDSGIYIRSNVDTVEVSFGHYDNTDDKRGGNNQYFSTENKSGAKKIAKLMNVLLPYLN